MSDIQNRVKAIIVDKLGVDESEVKPEATFTNDLGADSLDTVELIMELEKEQLEADLRFKSKELSGVVMTNIAHQEFLNSLKEELQQQKLSGQYTRKNLDKLLSMINQNMVSDEENWNMFQSNFDRIHENFFRNLKEKFPDLTSGDLRLCALLRLNLPTKEIAKLMNISVRGVDAARYRLRKKLGLPPESSLTDFMIAFK